MPLLVSTSELAVSQEQDEELKRILQNSSTSLNLQRFIVDDNKTLYCDTTMDTIRPYVPLALRRRIFDMIHQSAHPGSRASVEQIHQKFVWPGMNRDIRMWCRTCLPCQQSKIGRHVHNIPRHYILPSCRFQQVHIDIVGPLPPSHGYRYCLTMIDRYTCWPEAAPITDIRAETVCTAFNTNWIARFGAPEQLVTDQGSQFEGALFKALCKLVGCKKNRTSAYHPASNGMIERWHRSLKSSIRCHENDDWVSLLPTVLLGLRTCYKPELKSSAAELTYGTCLRVPGEFFLHGNGTPEPELFLQQLRSHFEKVRATPATHKSQKHLFVHKDLHSCTHVFLRDDRVKKPLQRPYLGPYEVVRRINDQLYTIKINGNDRNISIERLKPAYIENPDMTPETERICSSLSTPNDPVTPRIAEPRAKTSARKQVSFVQ